MRSKLFVPGVRPELFAKALAGEADALSLDLEDSVPESRKQEAREQVAAFVQTAAVRDSAKLMVVRVNALDTPHLQADLDAVARSGVDLINLPKVESAQQVLEAVSMLERAEAANGLTRPIGLLLTIETPRGLRHAAAIASAHPRVAGLQVGLADLFEPFGIDRRDAANVHSTLFAVRMAAAEAGVFAWDAAFAGIGDAAGFQAEAAMARRLGYVGKTCIHPTQVALANAAFLPDANEIAAARRIVAAAGQADNAGRGAFLVDGRMVDLPFLKRAQALLASVDSSPSQS
ncbi:CoA ester lyase [Pseudoxanthomonas gei]|uniref:CoA ester lyase n=1 Tax=Pseudoxanthomonas gei TaxID=1383030 RepID=A0ABX0AAH5_9GAMM|nr:CoA ester lyase [Pseudoxanthomonas gei]NDK38481.1 CoA ester lyase [Pseudoxanthomonas gei]